MLSDEKNEITYNDTMIDSFFTGTLIPKGCDAKSVWRWDTGVTNARARGSIYIDPLVLHSLRKFYKSSRKTMSM